jgi:hypothetical protein
MVSKHPVETGLLKSIRFCRIRFQCVNAHHSGTFWICRWETSSYANRLRKPNIESSAPLLLSPLKCFVFLCSHFPSHNTRAVEKELSYGAWNPEGSQENLKSLIWIGAQAPNQLQHSVFFSKDFQRNRIFIRTISWMVRWLLPETWMHALRIPCAWYFVTRLNSKIYGPNSVSVDEKWRITISSVLSQLVFNLLEIDRRDTHEFQSNFYVDLYVLSLGTHLNISRGTGGSEVLGGCNLKYDESSRSSLMKLECSIKHFSLDLEYTFPAQ